MSHKKIYLLPMALVMTLICSLLSRSYAHAAIQPLIFPVIGQSSYSNDFNASRSNGIHHAIDIIAGKHQKVVSASDGIIRYVPYPQPSYGYYISIQGTDGYTYNYLHLNNDRLGTDDGKGGGMYAYAPDIVRSNPVKKG